MSELEIDPPKKDQRPLGIGLALLAAACLLYGSFTRNWLVNAGNDFEIHFGLREVAETGWQGMGKTQSNAAFIDDIRDHGTLSEQYASSAFSPCGWLTLGLSLLAAAGLLVAAGLAIARKRPQLPVAPTTPALLGIMAGLVSGCVFVATKPGPAGYVGVGMSFWVFGVGCVIGIAGAQVLAKVNRPVDPDLMEDAMNPDEF